MNIHPTVTLRRVEQAVYARIGTLSDPGFCCNCGAEHGGIDPDGEEYPCESCGEPAVFGATGLYLHHIDKLEGYPA